MPSYLKYWIPNVPIYLSGLLPVILIAKKPSQYEHVLLSASACLGWWSCKRDMTALQHFYISPTCPLTLHFRCRALCTKSPLTQNAALACGIVEQSKGPLTSLELYHPCIGKSVHRHFPKAALTLKVRDREDVTWEVIGDRESGLGLRIPLRETE